MNEKMKNLALWAVIIFILMTIFSNFSPSKDRIDYLRYSEFMQRVDQGDVEAVEVSERTINGTLTNGERFSTYMPMEDNQLLPDLLKKGVVVTGLSLIHI